jgi:hypothetical protein
MSKSKGAGSGLYSLVGTRHSAAGTTEEARKRALQSREALWRELPFQQRLLAQIGFPPDYWLPFELAREWRSNVYPTDCSRESVAQWRECLREAAAVALCSSREDLADYPRGNDGVAPPGESGRPQTQEYWLDRRDWWEGSGDRALGDLAHDEELLRRHDARLVAPECAESASPQTGGAKCGADANAYPSIPGVLELFPGGLQYRGRVCQNLSGKPWKVLREFVLDRFHRCSARQLRDAAWADDSDATDENVQDAVDAARKVLRKVMAQVGEDQAATPIRCIDQAPNLAWELALPAR